MPLPLSPNTHQEKTTFLVLQSEWAREHEVNMLLKMLPCVQDFFF